MTLLELGGGTKPHPDADVVLDRRHPLGAPAQDITVTPWYAGPDGQARRIPDDSIDKVYASHVLEHVPRGEPIIRVMNETWRVLKPGGRFTIILPIIGHTGPEGQRRPYHGYEPWADPTHVSFWWLPEAFEYFCEGGHGADADYGIDLWAPLGPLLDRRDVAFEDDGNLPASWWSVVDGWEAHVRLVKP